MALNASLMTSLEKRSSISLAAIYGLRMLAHVGLVFGVACICH